MKKYICKYCNKEFSRYGLGGHISAAHKQKNLNNHQEFICPICNKHFITNKGAFVMHIKSHDKKWLEQQKESCSQGKKAFYADKQRSDYARNYMKKFMKEHNPMQDPACVDKMVQSRKKWMNSLSEEEYQKFVLNFCNAPKKGNATNHAGKYTPTKPEQIIIDMNIPNLIYNGNLKNATVIKFKNTEYKRSAIPDFIYDGTNKIIEVFGIYWHPLSDEQKYINAYQQNGYKILIIWETDLYNNFTKTQEKIIQFLREE